MTNVSHGKIKGLWSPSPVRRAANKWAILAEVWQLTPQHRIHAIPGPHSAPCAPEHKAHTSLICMRDMKRAGGVWGTDLTEHDHPEDRPKSGMGFSKTRGAW